MILCEYVDPATDRVLAVTWTDSPESVAWTLSDGIRGDVVCVPMATGAAWIADRDTGEVSPARFDALLGWQIDYGGKS